MYSNPSVAATNHDDPTVLVVDDDSDIRRSISRLLRSEGLDVKTFSTPAAFLREEPPAGPSCVVLDIYMEDMTGIEVQDVLRRNVRRLPVVFLSGSATVPNTTACFKGGADDFLEKPFDPTQLIDAVYKALDHDARRSADRAVMTDMHRRYDRLTPREQEVMKLVVAGMLNKQVADALDISEKTVKVHRARVMEKMEADSLAALVLLAQRLGITARSRNEGASEED